MSNLEETIKLQQTASNPNYSIFVSASAGSGKTKILTDRVLRLLLDEVNPDKILCLTFTKVAAIEMKNRIYKELSQWAILSEDNLKEKIFKLSGEIRISQSKIKIAKSLFNKILDDYESLKISTIHSFCQNLMAKFPVESEIKPNFQIIDNQTEKKLLIESKNKLLKDALLNLELKKNIELISANLNENSFLEIILELINNRSDLELTISKTFGLENLNKLIFQILGVDQVESQNIEAITNQSYKNSYLSLIDLKSICQNLLNSKNVNDIRKSEIILNYLNNPSEDNFNEHSKILLTKENKARSSVFTKSNLKNIENHEVIISSEQKRILDLLEKLNSLKIANLTRSLLIISSEILSNYLRIKNTNNYLDYNDLISKSAKLLASKENSDWVKYKLDGSIDHILVDESQDTNLSQWQIIKSITEDFHNSDKKTIFVVGDEKQSIYGFQGSNPEIFNDIYNYYQENSVKYFNNLKKISLNNSFRSFSNILKVVDKTFCKIEYKKAISKINPVKHKSIKTNFSGKVEIWPIIDAKAAKKINNKDEFDWGLDFIKNQKLESKEILAKIIAKKIKSWIQNKKILQSENRAIEASDIMILLKNRTNNLGNLIIKYLNQENIQSSGSDRIDLAGNIIVKDLVALAKFLLLKEDDLNLAIILRSPIINISEAELFDLCEKKNQNNISLFESLTKSQNHSLINANIFLQNIILYHQDNPFKIFELFSYILEKNSKKEDIISYFGSEAIEIIHQFLNLCLNFTQTNLPSLENFVLMLENTKLNIKIENNHNSNQVKITTIHGSKGLEAKIVILADCAHSLKNKYGGNKDKISWIKRNEIKIPIFNASYKNELIEDIKESERSSEDEEYLRLLYVAMTRAEEELYITGFGKNINNNCWYNIIKNEYFNDDNLFKIKKSGFCELLEDEKQEFLENDEILYIDDENQKSISPHLGLTLHSLENKTLLKQKNSTKDQKKIEYKVPNFFYQNDDEIKEKIIYPSQQKSLDTRLTNKSNGNNLGKIIHKILEFFPKISNNSHKNKQLIERYLNSNYAHLTSEDKSGIIRQTYKILSDKNFSFLFEENSKSEVPIIGKINDNIVSGKIDKLIIRDNEILIIDYKSDNLEISQIKEKSTKYENQMDLYRQIICKIYPNKEIKCFILFTSIAKLYML